MFDKILVANRGEIALRVIRACRTLRVKVAAVYSEADANSLHVKLADEAYCIGSPQPSQSYLNIEKILEAAEKAGADAVHPGYGFLAESQRFASACRKSGVKFIGPSPETLSLTGNKLQAKREASKAGVPVVPGSLEPASSVEEAAAAAEEVGYPVLLKSVYGGGGRGIRRLPDRATLKAAFETCRREAEAAFGDGALYVEKAIEKPRHVEVQILADERGSIVHLNERECSIQRRHQKIVEEAPSPALTPSLRAAMGDAAIRAAKACHYTNAGTVEFLLDGAGNFYFIEVNARVQVEHLITEMITGVDIVREQILIASGNLLPYRENVGFAGWALDCRINAEKPSAGFLPSPGTVERFIPPGGPWVRVDSALYSGYAIPPYYDSLVAKVAAWGASREEAIARMLSALDEIVVEGVETNIQLHKRILRHPRFRAGQIDVNFIEENLKELVAAEEPKALKPRLQKEQLQQIAAACAALAALPGGVEVTPQPKLLAGVFQSRLTPWTRAGLAELTVSGRLKPSLYVEA